MTMRQAADHLVIDVSRQPAQIRCLHCGAGQDLSLPMAVSELVAFERYWHLRHQACQPPAGSRSTNFDHGLDNAPCP